MMTLADLIALTDPDTELRTLLANIAAQGPAFPITFWGSGGAARTLLEVFAKGLSSAKVTIALIAKGGILDLAEGPWLVLLAKQVFFVDKFNGGFAVISAALANAAAGQTQTIAAGTLTFTDGNGHRFTNITGGTLSPGGTLILKWQAESPGIGWNLPDLAPIQLVTLLPGVSITNPPALRTVVKIGDGAGTVAISTSTPTPTLGATPFSGTLVVKLLADGAVGSATYAVSVDGGRTFSSTKTSASSIAITIGNGFPWDTNVTLAFSSSAGVFAAGAVYSCDSSSTLQTGEDPETDPELRQRCRDQWSIIGSGSDDAAYRAIVKASAPTEIRRVDVQPNGATGDVTITVAGEGPEPISDLALAKAQAAVSRPNVPVCDQAQVVRAPKLTVDANGTIYFTGDLAAAQAAVSAALLAFANGLDIGGADLGDATKGVSYTETLGKITDVGVVKNVRGLTLTPTGGSPSTNDIVIDPDQVIAFGTGSLIFQAS